MKICKPEISTYPTETVLHFQLSLQYPLNCSAIESRVHEITIAIIPSIDNDKLQLFYEDLYEYISQLTFFASARCTLLNIRSSKRVDFRLPSAVIARISS